MKNQKGFAVLEGLLVLVLMAMISGIGWYVLKIRITRQGTSSHTASLSLPVDAKSAQVQAQQALDIKEWGVTIPLSQKNNSYYYKIYAENPAWAFVSSSVGDSMIGPSGGKCEGAHIAAIIRNEYSPAEPGMLRINNYAYEIAASLSRGPACLYQNQDANNPQGPDHKLVDQWLSMTNSFVADFKHMKSDQK